MLIKLIRLIEGLLDLSALLLSVGDNKVDTRKQLLMVVVMISVIDYFGAIHFVVRVAVLSD